MRNTIIAGLALAALAAAPAQAAPAPALLFAEAPSLASVNALAQQNQGGVQVWMDGYRDLYQSGDRMRVRVRSERDGYLAVFHIDTNGDVDIVYPRSQYDDGWVEGGRTLYVGTGGYDYVRSRGGYGMGYFMAVTLDEPLELYRVSDLYGVRTAGWDGNRTIFGDPFYAMDELVRAIVPEGSYGYESVDYTTYHVGQRYRYPRYACYDGFGDWYGYRGVVWDDCDRVRVLLVNYPWYYDAWRWRGPRRVYYERYYRTVPVRNRPLHGYKERTDSYAPPARTASRRPAPAARPAGNNGGPSSVDRPRSGGTTSRPTGGAPADRPGGSTTGRRPEPRTTVPGSARGTPAGRTGGDARTAPATRPTRGTRQDVQDGAGPDQDRPVQPNRERPTFQRRPPSEEPRREGPRRQEPRREEPRRETPPSRSVEPRREEPRREEPRRESPPARSAEPRRESRPPSSGGGIRSGSGPSRSSDGGGSRGSAPGRRPSE
jgi:Domain of unknown function (DUF4384)